MGNIMEIMRKRRSVRVYNNTKISNEIIDNILEVGANAPTGRNIKPTEFILVQDKDMLLKLSTARKFGADMLKNADAAILVLADKDKTDLWIEDASIAASYMHLTADALGIGSCWIQVRGREAFDGERLEDYLRGLLGFPENIKPLCILSLGNIDKHPQGHSKDEINESRFHKEKW